MRGYLLFDTELRTLLDLWYIGEVGSKSYRPGFCSRQLLSDYCYVWLSMIVLTSLLYTSQWLLLSHPAVKALISKFQSRLELDKHGFEATLDDAAEVQRQLTQSLTVILVCLVFGAAVPPLLCVCPLALWARMHTLKLIDKDKANTRWGEMLSTRVLIQVPIHTFSGLFRTLLLIISIGLFVDLQFHVAVIASFLVGFAGITLASSHVQQSNRAHKEEAKQRISTMQKAESAIHFRRDHAPNVVEFQGAASQSVAGGAHSPISTDVGSNRLLKQLGTAMSLDPKNGQPCMNTPNATADNAQKKLHGSGYPNEWEMFLPGHG